MINRLEKYDLNCSVFNSYDYDDCLDLNSLLCRFFTKINECIEASNKALTLMEWLKDVGLKQEVVTLLGEWKDNGTLAELISEQILTEINQNIANNQRAITELQAKDTEHDTSINELKEKDTQKDTEIEALKQKDTSLDGEISTINGDIEALQQKDSEHDRSIQSLDERVTTNEGSISSLNNNIKSISYLASSSNIGNEVNRAIASGYKTIKIKEGQYTLDESIILKSNVELYGDKGTIITTDKDIPIITTSKIKNDFVDTCYVHDLHLIKNVSGESYHLDLCNVNMSKCERIRCEMGGVFTGETNGGLIVWSNSDYIGEGGAYSLMMDKLDFRSCSIVLNITDCYLTNSNIWAKNRKYCLYIKSSSQQILNNQFVGSSWGGGIYIKNDSDYHVEILKINNNYFDGSYENIDSGDGIFAQKLRNCIITNNTFWRQSNTGITISNSSISNIISNNTFEDCGKKNIYGSHGVIYDIVFSGTELLSTIVSNNTYSCYDNHNIKQRVIDVSGVKKWSDNVFTHNIVLNNGKYDNNNLFKGFTSLTSNYIYNNGCSGHWLETNNPT